MSALTRDAELLGDVGGWSAILDHSGDEQTTTVQVQASVSVGHEGLLGERMTRHLH